MRFHNFVVASCLWFAMGCVFDTGPSLPAFGISDMGGGDDGVVVDAGFDAESVDAMPDASADMPVEMGCEDRCVEGEVRCGQEFGAYLVCGERPDGCLGFLPRVCRMPRLCNPMATTEDEVCQCPPACPNPGQGRCFENNYQVCGPVGSGTDRCFLWRPEDCDLEVCDVDGCSP